jgi:hypothetical protein
MISGGGGARKYKRIEIRCTDTEKVYFQIFRGNL